MKKRTGTRYHISVDIQLLRVWTHRKKNYKWWEGKATKKEVLAYLDKLQKEGFKVLPSCDNYYKSKNKKGLCKGHPIYEGEEK